MHLFHIMTPQVCVIFLSSYYNECCVSTLDLYGMLWHNRIRYCTYCKHIGAIYTASFCYAMVLIDRHPVISPAELLLPFISPSVRNKEDSFTKRINWLQLGYSKIALIIKEMYPFNCCWSLKLTADWLVFREHSDSIDRIKPLLQYVV